MRREHRSGCSGRLGPFQRALANAVCLLPDHVTTLCPSVYGPLQAAEPQFRGYLWLGGLASGDNPPVVRLLPQGESHLGQTVLNGAACGIHLGLLLLGDGVGDDH